MVVAILGGAVAVRLFVITHFNINWDEFHYLSEVYDYGAYGQRTIRRADGTLLPESPSGNAWGFQGRPVDHETGLVYMRARWLAPELGRFLSPDPIGLAGGTNLYAFVDSSPLKYTDPFGLAPKLQSQADQIRRQWVGGFEWVPHDTPGPLELHQRRTGPVRGLGPDGALERACTDVGGAGCRLAGPCDRAGYLGVRRLLRRRGVAADLRGRAAAILQHADRDQRG